MAAHTGADVSCALSGEFEALSEDDLELVEQNTGLRIARPEGVSLPFGALAYTKFHLTYVCYLNLTAQGQEAQTSRCSFRRV
jgi:hypothetical protein